MSGGPESYAIFSVARASGMCCRPASRSRGGQLDRQVLDQRMDAAIGRRIRGRRRGTDRLQAPHRASLHNRTATARGYHGFRGRLCNEKLALEYDAQEAIILSLGDVEERLRPEDAGVVEQDVETGEAINRCLHSCFSCRRQDDVPQVSDSALSGRVDFFGSGFGLGGIASDDDDRTAFRDKSSRYLLADA